MRVRKLSLREAKENAHTPLLALHLGGRMPKFYSRPIRTSVQFSCSVVSDSLQPQGLQHARPPCPLPTPTVHSNSCASSQWCHPTILSSVVSFSSHLQSFPVSRSFQISQLSASGGQSVGASGLASVRPVNIQDWFPLGLTGLSSLQAK